MNHGQLAPGAQRILDMRLTGKRPQGSVIVSLMGSVDYDDPVMHYRTGCDWRVIADLDVLVVSRAPDGIAAPIKELAWYPRNLWLWCEDLQQGWQFVTEFQCRDRKRFDRDLESLPVHQHHARWFPEWKHREKWSCRTRQLFRYSKPKHEKMDIFSADNSR